MSYLYVESDGEVFLIEKNGKLIFPTEKDTLPFEIKKVIKMPIKEAEVFFCKPVLDKHPKWVHKDDIPKLNNVDKIVRIAVNLSLVRHFSSAIIIKNGKVLLLKGGRGLTKGMWHFPGGFIDYPSDPETSVKRECMEELGVEIAVKKLIGIYTNVFEKSGHYYLGLPYICEIVSGELTPNKDEVADMKWMEISKGIKSVNNPYVVWTLKKLQSLQEKLK